SAAIFGLMPPNVLVIAVDGLRPSALGAYGNTTVPAPPRDELAAESLLVEWCYAASPDLSDVYRALWNSSGADKDSTTHSLPRVFPQTGYATKLVADDLSLTSLSSANDFDEIVQVGNESNL